LCWCILLIKFNFSIKLFFFFHFSILLINDKDLVQILEIKEINL
jgi:hypothetical protein